MGIPSGIIAVEIKHDYKVQNGKLLRCTALIENSCIRKIMITGDFFVYPENSIERLEASMAGKAIADLDIDKRVCEIFDENVTTIGFRAQDLTTLLKKGLKII